MDDPEDCTVGGGTGEAVEWVTPPSIIEAPSVSPNLPGLRIPDFILQLPRELRNILAGGIAGMVAKSVVAPLDRIKILYQISAVPFHLRDIPRVVVSIVRQEGLSALWKGNAATMLRVFPYSGIQFMVFDFCKNYILRHHHPPMPPPVREATSIINHADDEPPHHDRHDRKYGLTPLESLLAGMIAGTVSVICTYPLDLVRAQLAVLKHHPHHSGAASQNHLPNPGFVGVLNQNYRRAGVRGLFRGITPTLLGILPYSGIAFCLNEQGKRELQHLTGREVTTLERLQCGAISGLVAQTVTYPIEVTRRRMQTIGLVGTHETALSSCLGDSTTMKDAAPPTLVSTVTRLYQEQGVRGFLKGVSVNWMKGPVAFSISFTTFDTVQRWLEAPPSSSYSH
jgi:solute carrier family 25, member 42